MIMPASRMRHKCLLYVACVSLICDTCLSQVDASCTADLIRDSGHKYFLSSLSSDDAGPSQQALSLAVISIMVSLRAGAELRVYVCIYLRLLYM